MSGILYEAETAWVSIVLTIILGGLAAWQTGRASAQTWRPLHQIVLYAAGLDIAVRFLHYALFDETFLSVQYFCVDFVFLLAMALLGWRVKRVQQMATQYSWLYESLGKLSWRAKS